MTSSTMRLAQASVHFIGIGGIGMCGLAELLHNMGAQVTGSDLSENLQTQRLAALGIKIFHDHHASHIEGADVVVYSSAVKETNPEYREALRLKIPLIRRAEALAEIMRLKRGIAIAGTHGKTTTTSLTASIFLSAGWQPTIVVGGRLDVIKSTAVLGHGEWLIAEADESDGSFSRLSPELVVITNIDNDHLDHYQSFANLQSAFYDFASRIPFYGAAIVCGDDPRVREVFQNFTKPILFYGEEPTNDIVLRAHGEIWRLMQNDEILAEFNLPLPGVHNALNATAAILTAKVAGIEANVAAASIASFKGVDRRSQHKAMVRGIDFYDDYGHHPTEVEATLRGFRQKYPGRRLVVVFQPHRYTRTQICWEQFLTCFKDADVLYVLDIYPAGEIAIEGVSAESMVRQMDHPCVRHIKKSENLALESLRPELKTGDVVLTLGAGDVYRLAEKLMESMAKS